MIEEFARNLIIAGLTGVGWMLADFTFRKFFFKDDPPSSLLSFSVWTLIWGGVLTLANSVIS